MREWESRIVVFVLVLFVLSVSFIARFLELYGFVPLHVGFTDLKPFYYDFGDARLFPYLEKTIGYPIVVGFFIHAMSLLGGTIVGYFILTSVSLILVALASTYVLCELIAWFRLDADRIFRFWVFAPSLLLFTVYNWDIIAVFFTLLALRLFVRGRHLSASLALSLGFATKFYPALFLAPMALRCKPKDALSMLTVFAASFFVLNLPFIIGNFWGWGFMYSYQIGRPPNPDSVWSIPYSLAPAALRAFVGPSLLVLFVVCYACVVWKTRKASIVESCFASLAVFLLFNKIFSPQYTLWLLMFFVLSRRPYNKIFYGLEFSNMLVFFLFLYYWFATAQSNLTVFRSMQLFALARHAILFSLAALILRGCRTKGNI